MESIVESLTTESTIEGGREKPMDPDRKTRDLSAMQAEMVAAANNTSKQTQAKPPGRRSRRQK